MTKFKKGKKIIPRCSFAVKFEYQNKKSRDKGLHSRYCAKQAFLKTNQLIIIIPSLMRATKTC